MEDATVAGVASSPTEVPVVFGLRYHPLALLGSGGMGSVYLARDEELDELVALKVLRPELLGNPDMVDRFRDEVRLARRVSSPFVARTHDLAEHEGRWFVTMQYVEGETLSARLRRVGRLSPMDLVPIARDVCDGLTAVHAAGVVHRDLKPGNVLVSSDGRAVLTDFGIALRAESARAHTDGFGTPTYTAPEQLAGAAVDARADVFAMGAMLYAMITAQKPFSAARTGEEAPPDPRRVAIDVPDAFAAIVMRAMARDPRDRFGTSAALRAALDSIRLGTVANAEPMLPRFVRTLGAREARKIWFAPVELEGVTAPLGNAARIDLLSRLNARGRIRVVSDRGDAEAMLEAKLTAHDGSVALALTIRSEKDNYVFWHDTQREAPAKLPAMLERAAHAIERAFSPVSAPLPQPDAFPSAEVARLCLEGRAKYRSFWGPQLKESVDLFEQALSLAPDDALVVAWCAAARSRMHFFSEAPVEEDDLALRAVKLAPTLPEAHVALASSLVQQMRMTEAIPHYVEALRVAPGLTEQRSIFARILYECGAVAPALALAESTFDADQSFIEPLELTIRHHALSGRLTEAASHLERIQHHHLTLVQVAFARYCFWSRDRARFEAHISRIEGFQGDSQPMQLLALMRGLLAGERPAIAVLEGVKNGTIRRRAFRHQLRAECFAFIHDEHRSMEELEAASELGLFDVPWLERCPLFEPLRGLLRFEAVRRDAHQRAMQTLSEIERCLA